MKALSHINMTTQTVSNRLLIIQITPQDNPSVESYTSMVNSIFAASKLGVTIDGIVIKETSSEYKLRLKEEERLEKAGKKLPTDGQIHSYLLIQACQNTGGVFRELAGEIW